MGQIRLATGMTDMRFFGSSLPSSCRPASSRTIKPISWRLPDALTAKLACDARLLIPRLQYLTFLLMVIAVMGLGHMHSVTPGPSGYTRIVRDLGRKFCNGECQPQSASDLHTIAPIPDEDRSIAMCTPRGAASHCARLP